MVVGSEGIGTVVVEEDMAAYIEAAGIGEVHLGAGAHSGEEVHCQKAFSDGERMVVDNLQAVAASSEIQKEPGIADLPNLPMRPKASLESSVVCVSHLEVVKELDADAEH